MSRDFEFRMKTDWQALQTLQGADA